MSQSNGSSAWVGDLGRCISVGAGEDEIDAEMERLEVELGEVGELQLLAGKAISAWQLHQRGISPAEWRHALHKSEMTIGFRCSKSLQPIGECTDSAERRFVKGMLDLGRPYAITRYARWENIDYPSALTATLPYGIRALVNQFLVSEGIARTHEVDACIRNALNPCKESELTAYRQTRMLQIALHKIADDTPNHLGGTELNRHQMRAMLAFTRLYFSVIELRLTTIEQLQSLFRNYERERELARRVDERITTNGRLIRSWRLRHIQPLLNLYPYSIRYGLKRALMHNPTDFDRKTLVNELALAHCGIVRMRASALARQAAKK